MPRIDLTTLIRDLAVEPVPVAATIKVQARDAHGPYVSVEGEKVIFSRQREIVLRPGQLQQIDVPPTDGAHFCWISVAVGSVEREWTLSIPDTTDVVPFGALVKVNPDTYQPTDDVVAEWDLLREQVYGARADAAASAGAADGHARDAATSAGVAIDSAGAAVLSAEAADASSKDASGFSEHASQHAAAAADSAGDASGFAVAAEGSAERADASEEAAAESKRLAGLAKDAAHTSEQNAAASEQNADAAAEMADARALDAASSSVDAGKAKTDTEKLKGDIEKVVQTATFLFVQQGDQPAGVLNLADVKTNAFIHRRLTGNVTGITLPTAPTPGQMITLVLTQDATGGRTLTTPAPIFGHEGLDPVLSTTAGAVDMIGMVYDGVRWWSVAPAQRGS